MTATGGAPSGGAMPAGGASGASGASGTSSGGSSGVAGSGAGGTTGGSSSGSSGQSGSGVGGSGGSGTGSGWTCGADEFSCGCTTASTNPLPSCDGYSCCFYWISDAGGMESQYCTCTNSFTEAECVAQVNRLAASSQGRRETVCPPQ